ncbi:TIGR01244 family sulfur transferase [Marinobacter sp. CHS3-4]|uniref:TIGR01244 family sulfur transferase n=1 Tax=Marinobacter sp. CHS3-4 TaxID=3045174 RepID=UPI0024B631EF|nr:TIGR01244 family sulfur transferase [Marinobacter sp. CHS3-4]MDI9245455.1 TIGR01244 family sulfur transferase [Marinobacter sp. CHS3-4]
MDIRPIDDRIAVSPQLAVNDIAELAKQGFKTIVANRPDREEPGQPPMSDLEAAAEANGLKWIYQPVESGNILDSDVDRFDQMIREADTPVLAFCRSGTRCTVLWALSSARREPADEIINKARGAGYDISGLTPRMAQQAGQ